MTSDYDQAMYGRFAVFLRLPPHPLSTDGVSNTPLHPPFSPQTNWLTERQVQTIKKIIKKCKQENKDIYVATLDLRATPVDSKLPSLAEMLVDHPITLLLPSRTALSPITLAQRQ